MAFEVDARTVRTIRRTLNALERKMARRMYRPDGTWWAEADVRRGADEGYADCIAQVRKWDREDGKKDFPACLPDGSDITTVAQVAALMGTDLKVAAAYVLEQKDVPMSLQIEAKAFFPPPEGFKEGIAFMFTIDPNDAKQLAVPGGTDWGDLHITLGYFGKTGDPNAPDEDDLLDIAQDLAQNFGSFEVNLNGLARFTSDEEGDAIVVTADSPVLEDVRAALRFHCEEAGVPLNRNHGYTAHMTLGFVDPDEDIPLRRWQARTIGISTLCLAYGENDTYLALSGAGTKDVHSGSLGTGVSSLRTKPVTVSRLTGRIDRINRKRTKKGKAQP